jgi:FAD dependent oxidoreductase
VQLTRAEIEGRRQAWEYARFLREQVPGFEQAVMVSTSPAIGVRESRRVHGRYRLTAEDVLAGRRFDDEIALCGAPIEDHHAGADTRWRYVPDSGVYGIPYRCLLPKDVEGLLVAGRCFSATHDAHASARSMGTCMVMGQAAGTAAALAAAGSNVPGDLPAARLRARLAEHGVLLEPLRPGGGLRSGPPAAERR